MTQFPAFLWVLCGECDAIDARYLGGFCDMIFLGMLRCSSVG